MRMVLLVGLGLLSGCNQLFIEGHVSALCQHLSAQTFQVAITNTATSALAGANQLKSASVAKTFAFDIAVQLPTALSRADFTATLSHVSISASGPTADFGFINGVTVTLQTPPNSALPEHTVVSYTKDSDAGAPRSFNVVGDGFDLAPYLEAGVMSYRVTLDGRAPMEPVTADVEACAEVSVHDNYAQ
jgi:hypothetical protein